MDGMPGGVPEGDDALREDLAYLGDNDRAKTLGAFLRTKHGADLARLLAAKRVFFNDATTKVRKHERIAVCAKALLDFDQRLGHIVLLRTERVLPLFDAAILAEVRALEAASSTEHPGEGECDLDGASDDDRQWSQLVHARIVSLPTLLQRPKVSDVRCGDVDSFLAVSGTVIRVGTTRVRDRQRTFVCRNKLCGHTFVVEAQIDMNGVIDMPKVCPSSRHSGGSGGGNASSGAKACASKSFREEVHLRVQSDYQELRVQDIVQRLSVGMVPRAITVMLQDDLVEACVPGDDGLILFTVTF